MGSGEQKISHASYILAKLYRSQMFRGPGVAFVLVVLAGQSMAGRVAAAGPAILWNCPRLAQDSEARAAVEARSRVELSFVSADSGSLAILCEGSRAQVTLEIPAAGAQQPARRVTSVELPPENSHAIDALVDVIWRLARPPRPSSATPPKPVPTPGPSSPVALPHPWEIAAGASSEIFSGALHGWAGPTLAASRHLASWNFGLSGGYAAGLATIAGLRVSTWSGSVFAESTAVGPLALGVAAGALCLVASAPSELAPSSNSTWSPRLTLRARLRLNRSRFGAAIGPELHYHWLRPELAVDDRVVTRVPRLALGVAAELRFNL